MALRPTHARTWYVALVALVAVALTAATLCAFLPGAAQADMPATGSDPVIDGVPSELQQRVEETAWAYSEAVAAREELELQVADCEARIAEIEAQIPGAQERAADAIYTQYRYSQNSNGLIELILSAEDYNQFIATLTYLDNVTLHTSNALDELVALTEQLEAEKAALAEALAAAQVQEEAAEIAMAEAIAAREEAQRRAAEEAARQAAAAAAAAQAAADAEAAANAAGSEGSDTAGGEVSDGAGSTETGGSSGDDGYVEDTGGGSDDSYVEEPPTVVWTERDAFIAEWGPRIDSFLYGFPLYGYGSVFAAAAWDYGVDPRWSPAISFVESTCGKYCFRSYNAWGWGNISWSSWEEAIYAHVGGLSRGYGYTITYEAACKYCPPNADYWYATVSAKMAQI